MKRLIIKMAAAFLLAPIGSAAAQTDTTFTYQGSLNDQGAAANGSFNLTFALFDALSGGGQVGSTIVMNGVPVSDGLLTAELDFGTSAFDNTGRWLEIAVNGNTLSPRQPISRSPYSIQTRGIVVDANNNVGIGTSTPNYPLHVEADAARAINALTTAATGTTYGVYGRSNSTSGRGVFGWAPAGTGTTYGGLFENDSTSGVGVSGTTYATSGINYAGKFESRSTTGTGVFGFARAGVGNNYGVVGESQSGSGTGVFGKATALNGTTYGGRFESKSTSGRAVYGQATATVGTTYGGRFESYSTSGRGVLGYASVSHGTTYGGWFRSASSSGHGVFGIASASSGINYGGWFESSSTTGRGVFGLAGANTGVNFGVVGHTRSSSGFDFWASGAGTNYGSPSSRRFKSNVVPIGDPLAKLAKLQGVYFDWDDEHGGGHDLGMIAEEVGAVLPEIVQYEGNGVDAIGMDYSKMTPLLVEAVNALRLEKNSELATLREVHEAEIDARRGLQMIIESQKTEIAHLFARMERLEALVEAMASK